MHEPSLLRTVVNVFLLGLSVLLVMAWDLLKCYCFPHSAQKSKIPSDEDKIVDAKTIHDIAAVYGLVVKEHVVTTEDGYLLVVHKLEREEPPSFDEENAKIVYFHHGLMTNSELFLLGSEQNKLLPVLLLDLGYEVWLGNNRGNKYSRNHLSLSVSDPAFWDFSLDDFALYDIPNTIDYIQKFHNTTNKITYIGFSQGSTQLFASLSLKPALNNKINLFVALSPVLIPRNLHHPFFKTIVKFTAYDNSFLYSLFGNKAIMSSVSFWSSVFPGNIYKYIIDRSLVYLFGWSNNKISAKQKRLGYPHLFSNSSVKAVVHWFQIIDSRKFQMFNQTGKIGFTNLSNTLTRAYMKSAVVTPFPVSHHLNVPMLLVYGDADSLVDMNMTIDMILKNNTRMKTMLNVIQCSNYEHMDTLWSDDVYKDIFEKVIKAMEYIHKF